MKKLLLILLFVPLVSFAQSQKKIKKIAEKTIKIYLEKEIINESRNNCSSCSLSFVKNRDDELDFHSKFSFALRDMGFKLNKETVDIGIEYYYDYACGEDYLSGWCIVDRLNVTFVDLTRSGEEIGKISFSGGRKIDVIQQAIIYMMKKKLE
mgnify:CR=1 FL=1